MAASHDIRKKLRHFFHSKLFHVLLGVLIAIDLVIVLFDIVVLLLYCGRNMPPTMEHIVHDIIYISITILGVFLVELTIQIYAFGFREWSHHWMHIFDYIIVFITFTAEISLHGNAAMESVVGLLITFRLWRLVRVIHVTTEVMDLRSETERDMLQKTNKTLRRELTQTRIQYEKVKPYALNSNSSISPSELKGIESQRIQNDDSSSEEESKDDHNVVVYCHGDGGDAGDNERAETTIKIDGNH